MAFMGDDRNVEKAISPLLEHLFAVAGLCGVAKTLMGRIWAKECLYYGWRRAS